MSSGKVKQSKVSNILIVDDDENIRQLMCLMFETRGLYRVEMASNGFEGFQKLKSMSSPCVIFLDLMMPVCSGWEFLDMYKSAPELSVHRVIVMSASKPDLGQLGAFEFLEKPLDMNTIFEMIDG